MRPRTNPAEAESIPERLELHNQPPHNDPGSKAWRDERYQWFRDQGFGKLESLRLAFPRPPRPDDRAVSPGHDHAQGLPVGPGLQDGAP